eukprot:215083-Amphidinium_carterae.3
MVEIGIREPLSYCFPRWLIILAQYYTQTPTIGVYMNAVEKSAQIAALVNIAAWLYSVAIPSRIRTASNPGVPENESVSISPYIAEPRIWIERLRSSRT